MKRKFLLSMLILSISFTLNVNAANNPYSSKGPYGVNCTWYTWKKAYDKTGVQLPGWGNAKTWYNSAKKAGYSVGSEPKKNSIVVWNMTSYGHVAFVERVSGDKIYVWDSDYECFDEENPEYKACMEASVSEETDRACKANAKKAACEFGKNQYDTIGYIYLDEAPKNVNAETTTKVKTTTTKKITTTVAKSNNNFLSSIVISNGNIIFDKNTLEYNLVLENEVDKINIEATAEDSNAKIIGVGDYNLIEGNNDIKLTVTSENGEERVYTLHILRNEKKEEIINDNKEEKKKDNFVIYIIISGVILLLIISLLIVISLKKKEKIM